MKNTKSFETSAATKWNFYAHEYQTETFLFQSCILSHAPFPLSFKIREEKNKRKEGKEDKSKFRVPVSIKY